MSKSDDKDEQESKGGIWESLKNLFNNLFGSSDKKTSEVKSEESDSTEKSNFLGSKKFALGLAVVVSLATIPIAGPFAPLVGVGVYLASRGVQKAVKFCSNAFTALKNGLNRIRERIRNGGPVFTKLSPTKKVALGVVVAITTVINPPIGLAILAGIGVITSVAKLTNYAVKRSYEKRIAREMAKKNEPSSSAENHKTQAIDSKSTTKPQVHKNVARVRRDAHMLEKDSHTTVPKLSDKSKHKSWDR